MVVTHWLIVASRSIFEIHCKWHSERQAQLRRPKQRQYRTHEYSHSGGTASPTISGLSEPASLGSTDLHDPNSHLDGVLSPEVVVTSLGATPSNGKASGAGHAEEPVGIHTVEDILRKFPESDEDHNSDRKAYSRDLECPDCHAVFFSRADCDYHQRTSLCPDSAAVAFVMISDATQPGGYRVERRLLQFDVAHSRIKCPKCKLSFATQDEVERHQISHVTRHLECVHCQRLFHTVTELESHYDWHDDMEFRHHRNRIRAKQPGLKLLSELGYRDQTKLAVPTFRRQWAFPGPATSMPIIHEAASAGNNDPGRL